MVDTENLNQKRNTLKQNTKHISKGLRVQWVVVLTLMACGFLTGCEKQGSGARSGFLSNYWQLKPNPAMDGALHFRNPLLRLDQYDKFMVDPIFIQLTRKDQNVALDPVKLGKLTDFVYHELVKGLLKNYQVVGEPGPKVLRIRAAITDVRKTSPVNMLPQAKLLGLGLGGASMEAELIDSVTGERVEAVVDSRTGKRISLAGLGEFDHAHQVMTFWVERFIKRLDEAHGLYDQ